MLKHRKTYDNRMSGLCQKWQSPFLRLSLLSAGSAQNIKPPISYVQERGGSSRCGSAAAVGLRRGDPRDERVGPLDRLADVLDDHHAFGKRLVLLIPPLASLDRRRPGLPLPVGEEPLARALRRSEVYVAVREHDL